MASFQSGRSGCERSGVAKEFETERAYGGTYETVQRFSE